MGIDEARTVVDRGLSRLAVVREQFAMETQALAEAEERETTVLEALDLTQIVAQQVQQLAHTKIAGVVTKCLEAVFDEPYQFRIEFERKRNQTEARLVLERDGLEVDPMSGSGGGVVDTVAFALRVACLVLSRPKLQKLLILDEPFKYVSADYLPRVRQLLETLSEEMGVQILMITHIPALETGAVVRLG